jgi:hypothetical protein
MSVDRPGRIRRSIDPAKLLMVAFLGATSFTVMTLSATSASANTSVLKYVPPTAMEVSPHDAALTAGGLWDQATELPGSTELNVGGNAGITTISCSSANYCSAGGSYTDGAGKTQAFVATETDFIWSTVEVPGTATLNAGGNASLNSISCSSAGNCGAGGSYTDGAGNSQGFVVNETNGVWDNATEVIDPSAKAGTGLLGVNSISCTGLGSCSAVGEDLTNSGNSIGYAVVEAKGSWSDAIELSITTNFGVGGTGLVAVSCSSPGNCGAVGNGLFSDKVTTSGTAYVPYEVDETNGTWGTPIQFPGLDTLNTGENAAIFDVSCGSPGYCSAGGSYTDSSGVTQAFVNSDVDGAWGTALQVPSISRLTGGDSTVYSLSCTSPGNCGAIGAYADGSQTEDFVADEYEGIWLGAEEIPGSSLFVEGTGPGSDEISCSFSGTCSAAGLYLDGAGNAQAFVVYELGSTWSDAVEVPGTIALNAGGGAAVTAISCSADSGCGAGGFYADASANFQAFVTNMSPLYATQATLHVTSTHGTVGKALPLTSSGGSGTGFQYFSVVNGSAKGCAISPTNALSATTTGTCLVTVSRTNDGTYLAASSAPTPVSFALPARPRPVTVIFDANSSALSPPTKNELESLSKKLIKGASVTVIGSALGDAQLANSRARAVSRFLSDRIAISVTVRTMTTSAANTATVETTKE